MMVLDVPVFIAGDLEDFRSEIEYVVDFVGLCFGLRIQVRQLCSSLIVERTPVYSGEKVGPGTSRVFLFQEAMYQPVVSCEENAVDGPSIWTLAGRNGGEADLLASVFRLLTLMDEDQVSLRDKDRFGSFRCDALPSGRRSTTACPVADNAAKKIVETLLAEGDYKGDTLFPRWPSDKRFAVCITHDTDAVSLGHPLEIFTNGVKALTRLDGISGKMALKGLGDFRRGENKSLWGVPGWLEYERARNIRSTFFLSVPPQKGTRYLHDCKSTISQEFVDDGLMRKARDEGWEFGLHAALSSLSTQGELAAEKRYLEKLLGFGIEGVRHHYLAFGGTNYVSTFREQMEAGFVYDSSVGWKDECGFRAGTAFPYSPFDSARRERLGLLEIPLTIMDCNLMCYPREEAMAVAGKVIDEVKRVGGVLVLNWHTESFCNRWRFEGYVDLLDQILNPLLADPDAWFATTSEVARWWKDRMKRIGTNG